MITDDDAKQMRERAEGWLREPASYAASRIVSRDNAINEEHLALDVIDLLADRDALRAQLAKYERRLDAAGLLSRIDVDCETCDARAGTRCECASGEEARVFAVAVLREAADAAERNGR